MVKIVVTHNVKPKRTENLDVTSFEDLVMQIDKIFNIEPKNIKFMKPPLKVLSILYFRMKLHFKIKSNKA